MSSSQKLVLMAAGTSLKARGMGGGTRIFVTESARLAAKKMWFAPGAAGWTSTARTLVPETRAELGNANGPKQAGLETLVCANVAAVIGPAARFRRSASTPFR